jgi:hypothetical protein
LYYARAVGPTVLMPLNDIAAKQTKATEKTQAATNQLLDYLATHPDATIRYHASGMILHIHSDASYLSVSNDRSRLGGLFFSGNKSPEQETLNRSILNVAAVIKNVVASAEESEVGACFYNALSGAPLRVTLPELGHIVGSRARDLGEAGPALVTKAMSHQGKPMRAWRAGVGFVKESRSLLHLTSKE